MAFILSDDGAADVLLVPDTDGIDHNIIRLLRSDVAQAHEQVGPQAA